MRPGRTRPPRTFCATLALALLSLVGLPTEAEACGGFFCSRSPVDQTAEHIIFTVNDDHTVTAYVQIQYAGDKDDFAWIIPAPGVPTLAANFPDLAMRGIDVATQPQYYKRSCVFPPPQAAQGGAGGSASSSNEGVTVLATQSVGPFDTVTLEGTSADVLVKWLQDNGYRITDKMIPLIQPYVEGGLHFVAMKLQADKAVTDIKPLVMTYDSDKPMIPIRLTSVAAQPEMGIVTFILSNRRWAPENYIDLKIPDSLVDVVGYGGSNYLKVVSVESDKVGGQAFVTEYAKPTTDLLQQVQSSPVNPSVQDAQTSRDALVGLLTKFPYVTRLYARMSAEEMTDDPIFMPSSDTSDVSNVHDLTDPNFDISKCTGFMIPPQSPCDAVYCGRRGVCVNADVPVQGSTATTAVAACVCANDATARVTTTGGNGLAAAYCEPTRLDLDGAGDATGPLLPAACEGFDCGAHGACVGMNGNPSCQCEGGYGAVVTTTYDSMTGALSTRKITCEAVKGTVPALPVVPPVGQTKIPDSPAGGAGGKSTGTGGTSSGAGPSGGGSTSTEGGAGPGSNPMNAAKSDAGDSGCSVSDARGGAGLSAPLFGLAALLGLGLRRRRTAGAERPAS